MKQRKVLVLYAKGELELINRKSALGSYIFCLCELLQNEYTQVFVNGVPFVELKKKKLPTTITSNNTNNIQRYLPQFFKKLIKDILVFRTIKSLTQKVSSTGQYDSVLEFYSYASNIGLKISQQQNIPLLLVYDAPVLDEYVFFHGKKIFFKRTVLRRELNTLLKATKIVVYSNAVGDHLKKLTGKNIDTHVHQNVDFTRFDFIEIKPESKDLINIGFVGSFLKWHRADLLVKAFGKLKQEGYKIHLYLLGMGLEFNSIKQLVEASDYKNDITMPGFIDGVELLEMKKKIHIGVMPSSNWYGAPNKIFEYGASKMAVVAPSTPTIVDLFVDKKELFLFENNSEEGLYSALKQLCDDKKMINLIADNLQQKVRLNYSANNTLDFYNSLI
jgi:glycosyltransferase involved in cell wall biosynthesis